MLTQTHLISGGQRDLCPALLHQEWKWLQAQAWRIQSPAGPQDIVALTAGRANECCRFHTSGTQLLTARWAGSAIGVERLVDSAKQNRPPGNFDRSGNALPKRRQIVDRLPPALVGLVCVASSRAQVFAYARASYALILSSKLKM